MSFRFVMPMTLLLASLVFLSGCEQQGESDSALMDRPASVGTVELAVDFQSDRDPITVRVPCSGDSTVFSILERAQNMNDLKFKAIGTDSPQTTFVQSIGGVDNLGGAGDNWVFMINGEMGSKGAAMCPVNPGDKITWTFGKYVPAG